MAEATGLAIADISVKQTGSASLDTKAKSLRERWMGSRTTADDAHDGKGKVIQRNMHVKLEISEGRGAKKKVAVENYIVKCVYTKTYNKWMPCDVGKQLWTKGMNAGKFRVLLRMIKYDNLMGKYRHEFPTEMGKWGKRSMYVLCDASQIVDVVQMLGPE